MRALSLCASPSLSFQQAEVTSLTWCWRALRLGIGLRLLEQRWCQCQEVRASFADYGTEPQFAPRLDRKVGRCYLVELPNAVLPSEMLNSGGVNTRRASNPPSRG